MAHVSWASAPIPPYADKHTRALGRVSQHYLYQISNIPSSQHTPAIGGLNMNGIFGNSNAVFQQSAALIQEQQRVGMQSAALSASSSALQSSLQALQGVARNIGN